MLHRSSCFRFSSLCGQLIRSLLLWCGCWLYCTPFVHGQSLFSDTTTDQSAASRYVALEVSNDSLFHLASNIIEFTPFFNTRFVYSQRINARINQVEKKGIVNVPYRLRDMKVYDSTLLFVGSFAVTDSGTNQSRDVGFFAITRMNGDTVALKVIDANQNAFSYELVSVAKLNQAYYVVGTKTPRTADANGFRPNAILVIRYNALGNETARYEYKSQVPGISLTAGGIDRAAFNRLVIGGSQAVLSTGPSPSFASEGLVLMITPSGKLIHQYKAPAAYRLSPLRLKATSDGGVVMVGSHRRPITQQGGTVRLLERGYVGKLNHQLNLQWDLVTGIEAPYTYLSDLAPLSNGGYLAVGSFDSNQFQPSRGWMLRLNANGSVAWQRQFQYLSISSGMVMSRFERVAITPSNQFVVAGWGEFSASGNSGQNAWIIKTDSMGCLVPGCAVGLRELTTEPVYLKAWPNPVSDVLNVLVKSERPLHGAQFRLADPMGRTQRQWEGSSEELQYQIAVHDLPAGMYLLQLEKDGQLLASEKVMVAR